MKRSPISFRLLPFLCIVQIFLATPTAYAGTCTSPAGRESDVLYNSNYHTYQFCNGTGWIAYGGGASCAGSSGYNPTFPANSGYFVMTKTTYNGNLGGSLAAADALCFTELTSTNTGWRGYSSANANGQLIASKVHAFLCIDNYLGGPCNNLIPLTTYYYATAANSSIGGAAFTTDINGIGPNDTANWGAVNYFGGTYYYWSQRGGSSNDGGIPTSWPSVASAFGFGGRCNAYTSSSSGEVGVAGSTINSSTGRWWYMGITCDHSLPLICYVDP